MKKMNVKKSRGEKQITKRPRGGGVDRGDGWKCKDEVGTVKEEDVVRKGRRRHMNEDESESNGTEETNRPNE